MFWIKLKKVGRSELRWGQGGAIALWASMGLILLPATAIAAANSLQFGIEAIQHRDFAVAVQHLDQAIVKGDSLGTAYGHRCLAHLMLNAPQQAVSDCSAAIRRGAANPKLRYYRGLSHYRLGEFATAIADFKAHLHAQPEDARAYYNLGLAHFAQGQVAVAVNSYHQALTYAAGLYPTEMSNLYNDLGIAYLSSAKPTESLFALDQAVAMNTSDPRAYFNRGCVCHHQGRYAAALADFEQVLTLDPQHAETYFNRGLSKQQLGDRAGAIADLQAAIHYFQQQDNDVGRQRAKLELHKLSTPQSALA
jgi:tetratricopeptide (TPR) repeat protein